MPATERERSAPHVDAIAKLFIEHQLRAVAVVDESRCLVGVVSKSDLLRERSATPEGAPRRTASDIMSPVVHGLPEDAPVAYATSLMATESIHEVPIVGYVVPQTKG